MAGTINSLGIGSGVLTSDVIEQLRTADEARIVTPLDNKVTLQAQKEEAFTLIDSLLTTFKASVSQLGNDTLYQRRTTDISNGNLEVKAETGSDVASFSLETTTLAKKDINQSGDFSATTSLVSDGDGVFEISIDGTTYSIDYTSTTTLSELAQAINDEAGTKVQANVLQTGPTAFSLILSSQTTGLDQAITVNDVPTIPGSGLKDTLYNDATSTSGFTNNQTAVDAAFVYNGISVTRETNEVSDLINGVTLTLKTEGETANVNIKQDTFSISTEVQLLVDSYNALQANIHDSTIADTEAGTVGVFNGDSFVNGIMRSINSVIIATNSNNESFFNFGIDLSQDGVMSFNQSKFDEEFAKDPTAAELFFAGGIEATTNNSVTGLFETLNEKLNSYTKFDGLLNNFEQSIKTRSSSLDEERLAAVSRLDSRYAILTQQFIAYDAMISKLNSQFSSLQLQIQAQANGNN